MVFTAIGKYLTEFGNNGRNWRVLNYQFNCSFSTEKMQIPHSVSLLEIEDLLCVADRGLSIDLVWCVGWSNIFVIWKLFSENARILCYSAGLRAERTVGQLLFEVDHAELHRIFSIAHLGKVMPLSPLLYIVRES